MRITPLVTGEPYIRAYAGFILRNKDGYELGTLCLLYDEPKAFSSDDIDTLKQYARITEKHLSFQSICNSLVLVNAIKTIRFVVFD